MEYDRSRRLLQWGATDESTHFASSVEAYYCAPSAGRNSEG